MLVPRAVQIAIACLAAAALLVFFLRRRPRPPEAVRWKLRPVASLKVGDGPNAVASYPGVDGRTYGPLSFSVAGNRICILDSYRSAVLVTEGAASGHFRWRRLGIKDGLLEAVAWDARTHAWLIADNRHLTIWELKGARAVPFIRLGEKSGFTGAIENLAVGPGGQIFVSWASVGRGAFQAALGEYRSNGHPIRQHTDVLDAATVVYGRTGIDVPLLSLANLAVGPDGNLYVLARSGRGQEVLAVNPVSLKVESRLLLPAYGHVELLGLTQGGVIYVTENVGRRPGLVLAFDREGILTRRVTVPAETLYAGAYADVTPNGSLYLAESRPDRYRIWLVTRGRLASRG